MAYLRDINTRHCQNQGCMSIAKVTLISRNNANHGDYCRKCGAAKLKRLQDVEGRDIVHNAKDGPW